MPARDWYYACDGQQSGPVSSSELKQVADRKTQARGPGMAGGDERMDPGA